MSVVLKTVPDTYGRIKIFLKCLNERIALALSRHLNLPNERMLYVSEIVCEHIQRNFSRYEDFLKATCLCSRVKIHAQPALSKSDPLKYLLKRYPLPASTLLLFSDCYLSPQVELKDLSYTLTQWQTIHHQQNVQEQYNKFFSVKYQRNS